MWEYIKNILLRKIFLDKKERDKKLIISLKILLRVLEQLGKDYDARQKTD